MAAQGYQESQLDHERRSAVGAIGVMQIMPATGEELAVGDIHQLEPNIHGGVKYMRRMIDRYFDDPAIEPTDRVLFSFAAYNAGPGRVAQLRAEAQATGLDPMSGSTTSNGSPRAASVARPCSTSATSTSTTSPTSWCAIALPKTCRDARRVRGRRPGSPFRQQQEGIRP